MVGAVGSHRRRNRRRCRPRRHIGRRCRHWASLLHGTALPPSAALAPPPVAPASAPVVALRQSGLPPVDDRSGVTLTFGAAICFDELFSRLSVWTWHVYR